MANILIVDDQETDRFSEAKIIEDAGHTPFFAGDGEAAMTMYKQNEIDVVITDLRMPRVDGLSLIRGLLAHDPEAAIIAVSSLAQHLDQAEECGATVGLVKPVGPEDLIEAVQEILEKLPQSPPSGAEPEEDDPWGSGA